MRGWGEGGGDVRGRGVRTRRYLDRSELISATLGFRDPRSP